MAISQIYDMSARQVWVGRYDEHGSREVAWDVSPWTSKLGSDGVFALLVTRPRDTDSPYNAQVSFDASTNLATWAVTDVDTALKGWGRAELHYYVDGALVKSQTFVTIIEKAMFAGSTAPSAAEGWVERMEQAALDAQAAAETAEDAETTATSAATTATSAAATAITAANSASSSASSARADATTATNAATAAALSESAASTSATNAAASAEAASTSALTATTAASTATTKASQASASASTAATSATTATNKASEATTAASTATAKAGEASTSASTATSAKDTAVSASQTATTKATEATTAAATATSAATTATTAKDDAVSAKTAAQTAQTGAETAAASVQSSAAQIATNTEDIAQLKSDLNSVSEITRNLFFGGFSNGNIDANGIEYLQTNFLRCDEFISVNASTDYTLQVWASSSFTQIVLVEYKSDKTVATRRGIVSSSSPLTERVQTFTTGSTTAYIRFILYSASDISSNGNKAQIELGTTATEYTYHDSAVDRFVRWKFDENGKFIGENIENNSLAIIKTKNIFDYNYQFIYFADVVTGKYYADNGAVANAETGAIVPYGIPVKANHTYFYRGLYNRHCLLIIGGTITFFANTDTYVDGSITPSSDGFVYLTIPYDSVTGIKNTAMFCDGELPVGRVEGGYNVSVKNSVESLKNTIITVSTDGTKDYTSIKDAIDSITDASEFNKYTIQIYEGTYDIKSYYTAQEWAVESTSFIGLIVPNYVTLEGVGSRDSIILTATDSTPRNYISTLNLSEVCSLKNLTVKSNGLRYAVHDDYSTNSNKGQRIIENCVFEQQNGYYVQAYGAGFHDNDVIKMKSCICKTDASDGYSISFHNSADIVAGSYLEFENCRFLQNGLNLITIADGADNNVLLKGTKADSLVLNRQTSNTGIVFKVSGYANDITTVSVSIGDASDYVDLI